MHILQLPTSAVFTCDTHLNVPLIWSPIKLCPMLCNATAVGDLEHSLGLPLKYSVVECEVH